MLLFPQIKMVFEVKCAVGNAAEGKAVVLLNDPEFSIQDQPIIGSIAEILKINGVV